MITNGDVAEISFQLNKYWTLFNQFIFKGEHFFLVYSYEFMDTTRTSVKVFFQLTNIRGRIKRRKSIILTEKLDVPQVETALKYFHNWLQNKRGMFIQSLRYSTPFRFLKK